MDKQTVFFVHDEEFGNLFSGNIKETMRFLQGHVEPYLDELDNGATFELTITRKDMTQKEIDELPEI
jgi:hypothetical protein